MKWTLAAASGPVSAPSPRTTLTPDSKHAILRNFPVVGHVRFFLERFGPELRQYIVTSNDEERPVQPRPAPLGLRVGQAGEQLLRLRHRQRRRARRRLPDHQAPHLHGAGRADRAARRRGGRACRAPRCSAGRAGRRARVPPALGRQHLRDELRLAVGQRRSRRSTAGPRWPAACRTPARARCRRTTATAATSSSRSARRTSAAATSTADFDLARLKDLVRRRPVRAIEIKLSPGRQARPRRHAARRQGHARRSPRSAASARARTAPQPSRHAAFHDVDSMLDFVELVAAETGLPVGHQVGGRSTWASGTSWSRLMAGRPARGRLRQHRRRRGRHRRRAADLRRRRGLPVPGRLRQVYRRFAAAGLTDDVIFIGAGKLGRPGERRRRVRARRRHGQRRARGDAVDRLHPGPEVPHRPLPDRRRDPEPVAGARPRPGAEVRCAPPTTSSRCAATCSRSPRRSASCTPG